MTAASSRELLVVILVSGPSTGVFDVSSAAAFTQTCRQIAFRSLLGDRLQDIRNWVPSLLWLTREDLCYPGLTYFAFARIAVSCGDCNPDAAAVPWSNSPDWPQTWSLREFIDEFHRITEQVLDRDNAMDIPLFGAVRTLAALVEDVQTLTCLTFFPKPLGAVQHVVTLDGYIVEAAWVLIARRPLWTLRLWIVQEIPNP